MTRPDLLLVGTHGARSVPNVENEQLCFFLKKTAPVRVKCVAAVPVKDIHSGGSEEGADQVGV